MPLASTLCVPSLSCTSIFYHSNFLKYLILIFSHKFCLSLSLSTLFWSHMTKYVSYSPLGTLGSSKSQKLSWVALRKVVLRFNSPERSMWCCATYSACRDTDHLLLPFSLNGNNFICFNSSFLSIWSVVLLTRQSFCWYIIILIFIEDHLLKT